MSVWLLLWSVVVAGSGCWAPTPVPVVPAAPPIGDDLDYLPWAQDERIVLVVRKACRTLDVYEFGKRTDTFSVVFGKGNPGRKLHEGDRKTPTGLYAIVAKHRHPRWQHFLLIDYPNLEDRERHTQAWLTGELPRRGGGPAGLGSQVGIHGTDKPDLNRLRLDWTHGCVSLHREDIGKLAGMVTTGTLVLIQD